MKFKVTHVYDQLAYVWAAFVWGELRSGSVWELPGGLGGFNSPS